MDTGVGPAPLEAYATAAEGELALVVLVLCKLFVLFRGARERERGLIGLPPAPEETNFDCVCVCVCVAD